MSDWNRWRDLSCERNNRLRDQISHVYGRVGAAGKALDEAWSFLLHTVMTDHESVKGGLVAGVDVPDLSDLFNRIVDLRSSQQKVLEEVGKFWDKCGGPVGSIEVLMMLMEERVETSVEDDADGTDAADVAS